MDSHILEGSIIMVYDGKYFSAAGTFDFDKGDILLHIMLLEKGANTDYFRVVDGNNIKINTTADTLSNSGGVHNLRYDTTLLTTPQLKISGTSKWYALVWRSP